MPVDTLENLRMLSNIETSKEKLIQIVFSAQPEFEKTLNLQELKQLKQRISVKAVISPLDPVAGVAYIRSRLAKAAAGSVPFTTGALKDVVRFALGIPRVINILCDNCLINAYGRGQKLVNGAAVRDVATEYGLKDYTLYKYAFAVSVILLFAVAGLSLHKLPNKPLEPSPAQSITTSEVVPADKPSIPPKGKGYVDREVQRGDTLAKLVTEVYGRADKGKMALVKKANPDITDENLIVEGVRLRFPLVKSP